MINYPNSLKIIFDKLDRESIKYILVGGYVRDQLLHLATSKDIDIEIYALYSLKKLEKILQEFGDVSSVGKSFGVCKLKYQEFELDFSLPRSDNKIESGHRGFEIITNPNLDFTTASSRRDFTMNAIGYDVKEKILLDPFHGQNAIDAKLIKAVDLVKFEEDPLRVLRAMQFSARFEFQLEDLLLEKCREMIEKNLLGELPKERIFEEFKKLFILAKKPSIGLKNLQKMNGFHYFHELKSLSAKLVKNIFNSIDIFAEKKLHNDADNVAIFLALLTRHLSNKVRDSFLKKLTTDKRLLHKIKMLIALKNKLNLASYQDYDLYILATEIDLELYCYFLNALYLGKEEIRLKSVIKRVKKLNILHEKAPALLQGRDLIDAGLKPSQVFSTLLKKAYDAQLHASFTTYEDAKKWLLMNL